jgi:hypothetical protein
MAPAPAGAVPGSARGPAVADKSAKLPASGHCGVSGLLGDMPSAQAKRSPAERELRESTATLQGAQDEKKRDERKGELKCGVNPCSAD